MATNHPPLALLRGCVPTASGPTDFDICKLDTSRDRESALLLMRHCHPNGLGKEDRGCGEGQTCSRHQPARARHLRPAGPRQLPVLHRDTWRAQSRLAQDCPAESSTGRQPRESLMHRPPCHCRRGRCQDSPCSTGSFCSTSISTHPGPRSGPKEKHTTRTEATGDGTLRSGWVCLHWPPASLPKTHLVLQPV